MQGKCRMQLSPLELKLKNWVSGFKEKRMDSRDEANKDASWDILEWRKKGIGNGHYRKEQRGLSGSTQHRCVWVPKGKHQPVLLIVYFNSFLL